MSLTIRLRRAALCLFLSLAVVACAKRNEQEMPGTTTAKQPQTYTGVLPCADCPGIDQVLTLFPDGTYRMRLTYRERPAVFHELGRWSLNPDGARLRLSQASHAREYQVLPTGLRQLDQDGQVIQSPFNYVLTLQEKADPIAEPMALQGLFRLRGTTASLLECESGESFAVRVENDSDPFVELDRRYRRAADLGDPILVRIEGRFEERSNAPPAIRVLRFDHMGEATQCPGPG